MNPYLSFIQGLTEQLSAAKDVSPPKKRSSKPNSGAKVLLFSPHPDDECITGLLPLRLDRELGRQIINIPITLGSNPERQAERALELAEACAYLGWEVDRGREDNQSLTPDELVSILTHHQPEAIFFPHENDWNTRHIETHEKVFLALSRMPPDFSCLLFETEYWGAMSNPNLMVAGDASLVAELVAATSLHEVEVQRNPYHLSLPFWMHDNVRRGSELVCGQGKTAPELTFATLYRASRWATGQQILLFDKNLVIPPGSDHLKEAAPWKA